MFFIRSASQADLAKVSALLGRSSHSAYGELYGSPKVDELNARWHSVAHLATLLARPDSEFVVADDGRRIGGMAFAAMAKDEADVVYLHKLYIEPELFGQGIGRDLFAEVETCFPAAKRMRLEVEPKNERAVRFYAALGFHEVGWAAKCGDDRSGIPAMIMEKELSFPS